MRIHRREFLRAAGVAALKPSWPTFAQEASGTIVNDIHSQLNATRVRRVVEVDSMKGLQAAVRSAAAEQTGICIAGGRHAMGGQQFASGTTMLDAALLEGSGTRSRPRHRRSRVRHHVACASERAPQTPGRVSFVRLDLAFSPTRQCAST